MQIFNMSKKRFDNLPPLELPDGVFNTEASMFLIPGKNKWNKKPEVLKKLYHDSGEVFSNKLYTVNELIDKKEIIGIDELVMPESLAAVNGDIVGFTLPYIPNINLQTVLESNDFTIEQKVAYLKEIGALLDKVRKVREYTAVKDFYLNDIHENNFILSMWDWKIHAVDLDSAKIGNNLTCASRCLSPMSQLPLVPKYKPLERSAGGIYEVNQDTEIYCYIIMILNFFYGSNISKLSLADFYVYLDYLAKIGVSKEIIDMISYIYTGHENKNPYELLDELIPFYGRMHRNTFECVRRRTI